MFSVNARSYAFFLKKGLVGLIWMLWWCPCPWICRWHPTLSFFRPDDTLSHDHALAVVEACISDFRDWFIHNRLLNSNAKTDGCSHQLSKISVVSIAVGDSTIQVFPIRAAPDLTLRCQCQSIMARFAVKHSMAMYKIRHIMKFLSPETTKLLSMHSSLLTWTTAILFSMMSPITNLIVFRKY